MSLLKGAEGLGQHHAGRFVTLLCVGFAVQSRGFPMVEVGGRSRELTCHMIHGCRYPQLGPRCSLYTAAPKLSDLCFCTGVARCSESLPDLWWTKSSFRSWNNDQKNPPGCEAEAWHPWRNISAHLCPDRTLWGHEVALHVGSLPQWWVNCSALDPEGFEKKKTRLGGEQVLVQEMEKASSCMR